MKRYLVILLCFFLVTSKGSRQNAALGDFFRRMLPQDAGRSDWTKEAQRNLSRFESRLLRHTLSKLHSSHDLGIVPFDLFDPVVTCPPPSKLMRLDPGGPVEKPTRWVDGAKWMCVPFPRTARPGCVVLSFGSNDQFEFEQAALDMTPCTIHTFDCTTGMLGNATQFESIDPARHAFHPYCVGSKEMMAMNPKQMLNWEGLLRVVRPLGPVTTREYRHGAGRQLQSADAASTEEQPSATAEEGVQGTGAEAQSTLMGLVQGPASGADEYVVVGGVVGRRGDAATAVAAAAEAARWANLPDGPGGAEGARGEEEGEAGEEDEDGKGAYELQGSSSWGGLLSAAHRRLFGTSSGIWSSLGLGGGGGGASGGAGAAASRRAGRRRGAAAAPEVFILKIDVEGFEWQLLAEWGPHTPGLPAFIAIEIHNWMETYVVSPPAPPPAPPPRARYGFYGLYWWLYGKRAAEEEAWRAKRAAAKAVWDRRQRTYAGELSLMFLHLARLGYAVVARENNPNGDNNARLCAAEFLFIRVRGPEEGRPGMWDWTNWFTSFTDGIRKRTNGWPYEAVGQAEQRLWGGGGVNEEGENRQARGNSRILG